MDAIARMLRPASVAVIGASADPGKTAGRPIAYLDKHGYAGRIYPVNPKVDRIGAWTCYPDIASLPVVPDVAMVLLGAERAEQAVRELAAQGCGAAIVLASGYSETGEEGGQRQQRLVEAAGGMRLLGPNTIGLVNLTDNIVLSPSGALEMDHFPVGSIGVVSQSGGILGSVLSRAAARGIGLSKLISTSNEVDLGLADFIDHLVDDPATSVIALYIESVRHPDRFRAACLKAARAGKPVVAFIAGRTAPKGKRMGHAGAIIGGASYILFAFVPMFIVASALLVMPEQAATLLKEDPQKVMPTLVMEHMPFVMQVLFFGALLSAIKSTASATLLAPSVTFTENIWRQFHPRTSDRNELRTMRITVLVFSALVLTYAIYMQGTSIYEMVSGAYQVTLVGAFIPLVFGLYWKRATTQGAIFAIVLGLVTWLMFLATPAGEVFPSQLAGLLASLAGMLVGSLGPQAIPNTHASHRRLAGA